MSGKKSLDGDRPKLLLLYFHVKMTFFVVFIFISLKLTHPRAFESSGALLHTSKNV